MSDHSHLAGRRIVFTGKQQVQLEDYDLPPLEEGEVLVRTHLSLMSTGTENIVFNRLFEPGTGFDHWVKYPFYPGYSAVGIVEATAGSSLKIGDRVAGRFTHRSHSVAKEVDCRLIPDGIPFEEAAWFAFAKIAFMGARAASYHLGDSLLLIGAGPIGQMSVRWARAAGIASIIVVDSAAERLTMAKAGGATATISKPIDQARESILEANGGRLPRIVIDSTGNAQVFAVALTLAEKFGKVVMLGDTGSPSAQRLTGDLIGRGLTVVGAHDTHNTPEWNDDTISRLFFSLVTRGCFSVGGLTTHTFKPEQFAEAYEIANRDRAKTMGIMFDWTV